MSIALLVSMLIGSILLGVATAKDDGRSACGAGGWADVVRADGEPFTDQGECVLRVGNGGAVVVLQAIHQSILHRRGCLLAPSDRSSKSGPSREGRATPLTPASTLSPCPARMPEMDSSSRRPPTAAGRRVRPRVIPTGSTDRSASGSTSRTWRRTHRVALSSAPPWS